jgi:hypothetical protein
MYSLCADTEGWWWTAAAGGAPRDSILAQTSFARRRRRRPEPRRGFARKAVCRRRPGRRRRICHRRPRRRNSLPSCRRCCRRRRQTHIRRLQGAWSASGARFPPAGARFPPAAWLCPGGASFHPGGARFPATPTCAAAREWRQREHSRHSHATDGDTAARPPPACKHVDPLLLHRHLRIHTLSIWAALQGGTGPCAGQLGVEQGDATRAGGSDWKGLALVGAHARRGSLCAAPLRPRAGLLTLLSRREIRRDTLICTAQIMVQNLYQWYRISWYRICTNGTE